MVSKNGTFRAEKPENGDWLIYFKYFCIGSLYEGDWFPNIEVPRISPSHLRELADFLETLNEKTE